MKIMLRHATFLAGLAALGAGAVTACSSSSTTPDAIDSGSVKNDSGAPADGGAVDAGACGAECKTELCANTSPAPNGACETCLSRSLDPGGACADAVNHGCAAFSDCVALTACVIQCSADAGTIDASAADEACKNADGGTSGCEDCCYANHPDGLKETQAALRACACGN